MSKLHDIGAFALTRLTRPRTIAGMALVAVGALIFANALFWQAGQHPAPFLFTREHKAPRPGQPDELVRGVQDALLQLGYYSGPLDGLPGPETQSAIEAFRDQSENDGTEEIGLELLSELRSARRPDLSPVATRVETPEEQARQAIEPTPPEDGQVRETLQPDGIVAAVQEALARAAYGPLTVDGVAGEATRNAIMKFQKDHKLPVTGEISDTLVVELRAIGALGGG